jgi:sec-independent protein translocase protein TatB
VNFSISEILLVLLIALLVIKPEQMPEVARTLGRLMKSVRGIFAKVKEEVSGLIDPADSISPSAGDKHEQQK